MIPAKAGESFYLEFKDQSFQNFYFDNNKLTKVNGQKHFGVVPLYKDATALISGMGQIRKSWITNPEQIVILKLIQVNTRELHNPSSIRIPANFFNELQKIEANQIDQEKNLIKTSLLKENTTNFCFETQMPMQSKQVSKFGSYRKLPTGMQYFHTGLDLRAAVGTPIYAMADGEISLAQKFVIPGNAVIIDHGNTIFSKYYHLSEIDVKPGQKIKRGELIGKSGGTGRVEAPHFHWEVAWKGYPTDPLIFIDTIKSICL